MNGDIEIRHLRYFVAVAEELHFGRAAMRLHIAQPPLSQQIRRLEEMLGHALFLRTSREVRLTAAGEELLERSRHTLRKIDADLSAVQKIGRGEAGALTVGFIGSGMLTALPKMLGRYRRQYPQVDLQLRELYTAGLTDALLNGTVDIGFLRDAGPIDGLRVEILMAEPFVVVLPRRHSLAQRKTVAVKSLQQEPFVLFARSYGSVAWKKTVDICEEHGFTPRVVQEAPQWLTIMSLVGAGLGVTIAPACVKKLAVPDTVCRKLRPQSQLTYLELACRANEARPIARAFSELARKAFSGH
ncbi:MAG TPA: LysR substrate-binding domain-containing protein [Silvibacterium sp.]|jgi:DNA-binding transcriptional LysR family regulator|nr:LysR substrate-binding domain-containing protein [Silvibacterium sp.]